MSIEKGDATKYVHTGNGELCYELNKALTVPETFPIYLSSAYIFDSIDPIDKICDEGAPGYAYFRLGNPNADATSQILAAGDGAEKGLVFSSGMAAITTSILATVKPGDHIVASPIIYGEAFYYLKYELKRWGVETTFIDFNTQDVADYIRPNTKLVYGETIANPLMSVPDIQHLADVAHANGAKLFIDNTFATPILCRPIEFGADIVIHSTSKYMDGHAVQNGGVIVDSGKFDWVASGKFPQLTEPDPCYHGVRFVDAAGPAAYAIRIRAILLRDTGATISPFNAFILLQGLETLSLRVERHVENALKVVNFLNNHPKVKKVNHPSLSNHPDHALYQRYFPNGAGSIFTFEVKGGQEEAHRFIDSLEIFSLLANVADVKSLVIHPASTTHSQLNAQELAEQEIYPGTVRLSIGTEHIDDLIADLDQALAKI